MSERVRDAPEQTVPAPEMAAGSGLTVTVVLLKQPAAVALIVTVVDAPTDPPVTIPEVPMAAIELLLLLHTIPGVMSLKVVVPPEQTFIVPVIVAGIGLTVKAVVATQPVVPSV